MSKLRIATWNTEWRRPNSRDGKLLRERLAAVDPDIVVLTETHEDFLEDWAGHSICGPEEYKEPKFQTCRSVLLWSKWPWSDLDTVGSPEILDGCFVKATASAPFGDIPVVGLIIPYHMSNVTNGTRNRRAWEDHERCLDGLSGYLPTLPPNALVVGDFNQRVPFAWGSRRLNEKLLDTFLDFEIVTTGQIAAVEDRAIDHIACGRAWSRSSAEGVSNIRDGGRQISDHFGLVAELQLGAN